MKQEKIPFEHKVVILGIDALDTDIIEDLMARGRLPNFQRLKDQGSYSPLKTVNPPQSPVAWSSFATGQNPGKHGVFDFIKRNPSDYGIELALSKIEGGKAQTIIQSKRFWQYLSDKHVPVVILGCPMTFPPDKVYGKMLSGMGVPDILGTEGTFSFITTEPREDKETTGGQVFNIKKSSLILGDLIGPKVATKGGVENVKVPFKVDVEKDQARVTFQKQEVVLKRGEWSQWAEVVFDLGWFRKAKGIVKFYLVETEPEFKLYISPINMDPKDPSFPISYPGDYSKKLAQTGGLFYTRGMPFDTWGLNEGRLDETAFLQQAEEIFEERVELLDREFSEFDQGVFYFYFEVIDIMQHMFWRYTDPKHPLYEADAPEKYKNMIALWYERLDKIVGKIADSIGEDDTLIILSDHGFGTFRRAAHVNTWLYENGYLQLENPNIVKRSPLFLDVDWSRTKAYSLGFNSLYVNVKGREKNGIVSPGKEMEDLKDEIKRKMKIWKDPKYGKPVIKEIYEQDEVFWGDYAPEGPDLLIGFNEGYRMSWQTAIGTVPKELLEDNLKKWSGSHLFDSSLVPGVVFSNRKIQKDDPAMFDIAPTVLSTVGFSNEEIAECDFDGSPLFK